MAAEPVDVNALAETVREWLMLETRLVYNVDRHTLAPIPGSQHRVPTYQGARDALAALDALLAEVDRVRREFARLQNEYEFDVAIPMDEQREHIERAEAEVVRLRAALTEIISTADRYGSADRTPPGAHLFNAGQIARRSLAAAGSPTGGDDAA